MTIVYKVLGQAQTTANTVTTVYTVPAGNSAVVSTVNVCNQNLSSDYFRLAVVPAGQTLSAKHYIAYNTVIPALDAISITMGITLAASDTIQIFANTANVSFSVFGSEIY